MGKDAIINKAICMSLAELCAWLRKMKKQRRELKGHLQDSQKNRERNNDLTRKIRLVKSEVARRQRRMEGF